MRKRLIMIAVIALVLSSILLGSGAAASTIGPVQPYTKTVIHNCAITPGIAWSTHTVYLRYWQDPTHNLVVDTTVTVTAGPTCYIASARTQVGYQIKYRVWGFLWYTTGWKTFLDNNGAGAAFGRTFTYTKTGYGEVWWNIRVYSTLDATDALTMKGATAQCTTYWPNPPIPGNEVLQ
jgi:hypothetical protein